MESAFAGGLPGLGVFPARIGGVIEVQKQTLSAIEKAKPEEVVPDKGKQRDEEDVPVESEPGAACLSFVDHDLRAQSAVPVHVVDVAFDRGVGMVDQVVMKCLEVALEGDGLVDGPLRKPGSGGEVG